jgi:hypothetical protein
MGGENWVDLQVWWLLRGKEFEVVSKCREEL